MTLPFPLVYLLVISIAVLDWFAAARGWRRVHWFAKPGVMGALFGWLWLATGLQGPMLFFGLGVLFSLLGDILLEFRGQGWFLAGLAAFVCALLAYVIGFNIMPPVTDIFSILSAILVAILFARLYRRAADGLRASGQDPLRLPVLIYTLALALFMLSGWLTLFRPDWLPIPSLMTASGAVLFVVSNALLALDKFIPPPQGVSRRQRGPLRRLILYQAGQILLISGVVLNQLAS
jgi:uncharacterized membrane protein YhhN